MSVFGRPIKPHLQYEIVEAKDWQAWLAERDTLVDFVPNRAVARLVGQQFLGDVSTHWEKCEASTPSWWGRWMMSWHGQYCSILT